jgi:hypothetical protein
MWSSCRNGVRNQPALSRNRVQLGPDSFNSRRKSSFPMRWEAPGRSAGRLRGVRVRAMQAVSRRLEPSVRPAATARPTARTAQRDLQNVRVRRDLNPVSGRGSHRQSGGRERAGPRLASARRYTGAGIESVDRERAGCAAGGRCASGRRPAAGRSRRAKVVQPRQMERTFDLRFGVCGESGRASRHRLHWSVCLRVFLDR